MVDEPEDEVPVHFEIPVSQSGDLWILGNHKLLCGDTRNPAAYDVLREGSSVDIVFTDPPYNVPIDGNVAGLGKQKHREFAMASGEQTEDEFVGFLQETLGQVEKCCRDGAIAYVCMDWRHIGQLLKAGTSIFDEYKNLIVWNKTNGGMGRFYGSKHELIAVFKKAAADQK